MPLPLFSHSHMRKGRENARGIALTSFPRENGRVRFSIREIFRLLMFEATLRPDDERTTLRRIEGNTPHSNPHFDIPVHHFRITPLRSAIVYCAHSLAQRGDVAPVEKRGG